MADRPVKSGMTSDAVASSSKLSSLIRSEQSDTAVKSLSDKDGSKRSTTSIQKVSSDIAGEIPAQNTSSDIANKPSAPDELAEFSEQSFENVLQSAAAITDA